MQLMALSSLLALVLRGLRGHAWIEYAIQVQKSTIFSNVF
jgi:hypothetical protein